MGGFNAVFECAVAVDGLTPRGRALYEVRLCGDLHNDDYEIPDDVGENPFTPRTERCGAELSRPRVFEGGDQLNVSVAYARHDRDATNGAPVSDYESIYSELPSADLLRF